MADVLIVCVREDEPQAKALADMFERAGFSVGGAPSNDAALRSSGAGVVVWSHASIRSRPFLDAAQRVVNAQKAVVACLIEPPPSASINDSPAFDLQGWSGDPDDPSLDPLFFAVDRMVNTARAAVGAPAAAPSEPEAYEPPTNLRPAPATPPYARPPVARTAPPQTRTPPAAPTPPGFQMRTPAAPPARTPPPEPQAPDPLSAEAEHWRAIRHSNDVADFLDYLQRYGSEGAFSELAENRLKHLQAAQRPARAPEPPPYQPPPQAYAPAPQPPPRREARRPDPPPPMFEAPPETPRRREPPPERRYDSERLFDSPRGASYAMREEPKKSGGGGFIRMLIIFLFMGGAALGAGYYFGFMPSMLTAGVSDDTTDTAENEPLPLETPEGAEATSADGAGGPAAVDFSAVQEPAAASTPRQQPAREPQRPAQSTTQNQNTSASAADTTVPSPQYSWREAANATPSSPSSYGGPVSLTPSGPTTTTTTTQPPVTAPQTTPASTTPQQTATPPGTVSWASRPTAARIAALYPTRALRDNVGGRVVLDCGVRADFSVSCTVVSETPTGAGFGQAAMSAANSYRAAATLSNGQSAVGARARLALVFRPPQD